MHKPVDKQKKRKPLHVEDEENFSPLNVLMNKITHQNILICVVDSLKYSTLNAIQRFVATKSSLSNIIQLCYLDLTGKFNKRSSVINVYQIH